MLLFLAATLAALLLNAGCAAFVPRRVGGLATVGLSGLSALLCLPPLLSMPTVSALALPLGPPGISLHLTLDSISAFFLLIVFLCGTAIAAFAAAGDPTARGSASSDRSAGAEGHISTIPLFLAGLTVVLLAADAVTLAIGVSLTGVARMLLDKALSTIRSNSPTILLAAMVLLIAVCLLAPPGIMPRFDAIRRTPVDSARASAAVALVIVGLFALVQQTATSRCWMRDALTAGAVVPTAVYLLIRLVLDLPGASAQAWWGFALLLIGGTASVACGWQAARHTELDGSVVHLARRQAGLAAIGLGLTLIAQSADLPDAASFALAAILLLMISSAMAGTLASLAAHTIGHGADTYRLVRLGGLLQSMPIASISLTVSLIALSALPLSAGFAAFWLLFQSILSAPRTGGVMYQLPLALVAAALALSAALAAAASVRLLGIVVLSRPRSVRGSAARDVGSDLRLILLTLSGVSALIGIMPGPVLNVLAEPVIRVVTGTGFGVYAGWATLSASAASPGYAAVPVLALLVLAMASVLLIVRQFRRGTRVSGIWNNGVAPAPALPFGDPLTQSTGAGFLPSIPATNSSTVRTRPAAKSAAGASAVQSHAADLGDRGALLAGASDRNPMAAELAAADRTGLIRFDRYGRWLSLLRAGSAPHPATPVIGLWAVLIAFAALLLVLALFDGGGTHG